MQPRLTRRYARTVAIVMALIPAAFAVSIHKIWVDTGSVQHVTVLLIAGFFFASIMALAVIWRFGEAAHRDHQTYTTKMDQMLHELYHAREEGHKHLQQVVDMSKRVVRQKQDQLERYAQLEAANEELKVKLRELEQEKVCREVVPLVSNDHTDLVKSLKQDKREREAKRKARRRKEQEKATPLRRDSNSGEIVEVCEVIFDSDDMTDW